MIFLVSTLMGGHIQCYALSLYDSFSIASLGDNGKSLKPATSVSVKISSRVPAGF